MNNSNHTNSNSILHIVKPNDSFYELAKTYHTTVQSIAALNPSANPRNLQIGTALLINPGSTWRESNNTSFERDNSTTNLILPNRVHPIDRPSTPSNQPNPDWPIFDNTSLPSTPSTPSTQSLQPRPTTPTTPTTPITPMPMPIVPINPGQNQPTPIQPITPLPSIPTPIAPILPTPIIVPPAAPQPVPSQLVENCDQNSICSQVRQLYSQQIFWNRILLNSIVDRTGQQNANTQRLMQNSVDMGHFYAKHYGNQAGQQIQDLFAQHNSIGRDLFIAMRDRRNAEGDRLRMQWYNNADQLSEYMGNLIPEIDSQELRRMMFHYLGSAELQAAQLISNNAQGSITTFDNIEREAMSMADYISNAIIGERLS